MNTYKRWKRKRRKKTEAGNNNIRRGKRMFKHRERRMRKKGNKTTMIRGSRNK